MGYGLGEKSFLARPTETEGVVIVILFVDCPWTMPTSDNLAVIGV